MKRFLSCVVLIPTLCWGQNENPSQVFQPGKNNYLARVASTTLFQVLTDGTITPTVGTPGTFSRASSQVYPNGTATTANATSGNPCVESFAPGVTTNRGGLYITGAIKNYILQSNDITTTWVLNGTAARTANFTTSPDGTSNADRITGSAAADGVQQASAEAAASNKFLGGVWLKVSTGTKTVNVILKDQAGSPATFTNACSVSTTWKQCSIYGNFVAATGNVVMEIKVGNTSGYEVYQYEASLTGVNYVAANDIAVDYDLFPVVPTTTVVANDAVDNLTFAGPEITPSRNQITWLIWVYVPTFNTGRVFSDKHLFNNYSNTNGCIQGAKLSASTATLQVCYGGNTFTDTTASLVQGRWNQVIIAEDYNADTYQTFLNGASVHTDTVARSPSATDGMILGYSTLAASSVTGWGSIIGRVEMYPNKIDPTTALNLYNSQKGVYGL